MRKEAKKPKNVINKPKLKAHVELRNSRENIFFGDKQGKPQICRLA